MNVKSSEKNTEMTDSESDKKNQSICLTSTYIELNEKCDLVINKLKKRKFKKNKNAA